MSLTDPRAAPVSFSSVAAGAFFLAGCAVVGGVLGLIVGVPLDKAITTHPHSLAGLGGIVFGVPLGMVVGLVIAAFRVRALTPWQRVVRGVQALLFAGVCMLGLYAAVRTGLMAW